MRIVRDYIQTFIGCISEPKAYIELLGKSKRKAIFFYVVTFFFVSILSMIAWRIQDFPKLLTSVRQTSNTLLAQVPDNAQFFFDSKTLRASGAQLPIELHDNNENFPYTLSFATNTFSFSPTDNQPFTQNYTDLEAPAFNATTPQVKAYVSTLLDQLTAHLNTTLLFAFPLVLLGKLLFGLVTLLFYTLFGQILSWLAGVIIPFRKLYKLGMYILPIAALIDTIAHGLFGGDVSLTLVAYIGIVILILLNLRTYGTRKT
ncbi:MAG TPA: DUF1189 family protein [Patescibacteria group bacterium]|nr:DUF1189 family protein [Patescibacteria group bacterium]